MGFCEFLADAIELVDQIHDWLYAFLDDLLTVFVLSNCGSCREPYGVAGERMVSRCNSLSTPKDAQQRTLPSR